MRIPIKFTLLKERTGWKRGRRYHRLPAEQASTAQERCVRGMLRCAIRSRDLATHPSTNAQSAAFDRKMMRKNALWARIFAQQIPAEDARVASPLGTLATVEGPQDCPALPL